MGLDYYKILNISKNATRNEIKKVYRELALRYHPDKNDSPSASTKFKEVAEAYLVLSDEGRRAAFDTHGEDGVKAMSMPSCSSSPTFVDTVSARKIFEDVFEGKTDLMDELIDLELRTKCRKRRASTGLLFQDFLSFKRPLMQDPPVHMDLHVTLEEVKSGCIKKMKLTKQVFNPDQRTRRRMDKILNIDIKPGTKEGTEIIFPKEGDEKVGVIPADIVFVLKDLPHALYRRDPNNNLIYTIKINLRQSLLGDVFEIPTLTPTRKLHFSTYDKVIKPQYIKTFPSEGLPLPEQPGKFGDLLLNFDIIFPERLSASQKSALRDVLY